MGNAGCTWPLVSCTRGARGSAICRSLVSRAGLRPVLLAPRLLLLLSLVAALELVEELFLEEEELLLGS